MPKFNAEQKAAIYARNPFLLCAAGAGSGKTTVMVESVTQKLKENLQKDISTFLIITFTNEAAGNMKRKVQERLSEEARNGQSYASRGLANLENATISTIHSFCKGLISTYFYAIEGMSPKFEIIEEARLERIFKEAYEAALDDICDKGQTVWTEEQVTLVKNVMNSFKQAELVTMCRDLYKALMGIPDPFDHLDGYIDAISAPIEENEWAKEVQFSVDMNLLGLEDFLRQEQEMLCAVTPPQCEKAAEEDKQAIEKLMGVLAASPSIQEKLDAILTAKSTMPTVRLTKKDGEEAKEWNEGFKELRNKVKGSKGVLDLASKSLQNLLKVSQAEDNIRLQNTLRGIAILLRATASQFREMKLAAQGIDYSDMEQMVYELVKRDDIREAIMESITDIYVDECQDVSAIQYAIINSLTGGEGRSIVRVGDIKQSIYGFRSAAPDLMDRDIQAYSKDEKADHRKIFFQENYRSCAQVIECINEVFDTSMEKSVSEIDYAPEDHLKANVEGDFGPVKVVLLAQEEAEVDMLEAQCEAAGRQIENMVLNGGRDYRDIVILVQNAKSDAPIMVEHFRKMHIPVMYDGGQTFYGLTEISSFLALLTVIDNDHTDVELVGTLRNVPFNFTDVDLAEIRKAHIGHSWYYEAFQACCERNETELDKRCIAARDQIHLWREKARSMSVSEFIWQLMRESGIYAVRGAYPDGRLRQLNLDSLYQRAVDMEKRGVFRLSDFLWEVGKLKDAKTGDTGDTPATMGEGDNFVRLMTMHKSKGLEFPVVILMNLQKNLRKNPSQSKMKVCVGTNDDANPPLGVYIPVISQKSHTKRDTYGLEAFRVRDVRTSIAEDTRLLYVAMTRAMENLILIGHYKEKETALWVEKTKVSRIWKTRSMLDLVMPALLKHMALPAVGETSQGGQWQLSIQVPQRIRSTESHMTESQLDANVTAVIETNGEFPSSMWNGGESDPSPLKTSVTSLLLTGQNILPAEYQPPEEEETVEVKRRPELPSFLLGEIAPRPLFMEEEKATSADIGSMTHRFLRLIDLSVFRGKKVSEYTQLVDAEIVRMRERSILTEAEAKSVYGKGAVAFLSSELGQRLISAPSVEREWPFTMQLRDGSPTMVQGIVDAAFLEDGQWILVDYKTDRDTREGIFVPRHEKQMNWYRVAVERLTEYPVKEMWLFALRAGRAYRVRKLNV